MRAGVHLLVDAQYTHTHTQHTYVYIYAHRDAARVVPRKRSSSFPLPSLGDSRFPVAGKPRKRSSAASSASGIDCVVNRDDSSLHIPNGLSSRRFSRAMRKQFCIPATSHQGLINIDTSPSLDSSDRCSLNKSRYRCSNHDFSPRCAILN